MQGSKYPKHTITRDGKVYSKTSKKFVRQCKDKDGYMICGVKLNDGRRLSKRVHRMVAEEFIPNPENKPMVNHKDGNKANNRATNLEWVTALENRNHAIATGLFDDKAENNPNSKLSNSDVYRVRKLYLTELVTQDELARLFKVSQPEIGNIVRGDNWRTLL